MKEFSEYKSLADQMVADSQNRMAVFKAMEQMFNIDPQELPGDDPNIKKTGDPGPSNSIVSGCRMLSATDPRFSVPYADAKSQEMTDMIEQLSTRIFTGASSVRRTPLLHDMVLSALLYGEIHASFTLVNDLIIIEKNAVQKARLERTKSVTPVMLEVYNPKVCHVLTDRLGVTAHLVRKEVAVGTIRGLGPIAEEQMTGLDPKATKELNEMYDIDNHAVWVTGSEPIIFAPLEGNVIPVQYVNVEGSGLFEGDKDVDKTRPFLYNLYKSGVWERTCLALTVLFSNMFKVGANPQYLASLTDPANEILVDYSVPGGVIKVGQNERLQQMQTQVFTGDFQQLLGLTDKITVDSTMYKTVVGEQGSSGMSYSLGALLSQNGRQALIPYQRMASFVIGNLMTDAIIGLKNYGGSKQLKMNANKSSKTFDLGKVPDDLIVKAELEISLPVDERQDTLMATQLTAGDHPLMDVATARSRFLKIDDSTKMDKDIIAQNVGWETAKAQAQIKIQEMMQAAQGQMQQPGAPQGMPPQPGGPQGLPPEMQGAPMGPDIQSAQPGLPMGAPVDQPQPGQLPPEMMGGQNAPYPA